MGDQMWAGANHTHISLQHIDELRDLVETGLPKETAEGVNSVIGGSSLLRFDFRIRSRIVHRPEFEHGKLSLPVAGSVPYKKQASRRLQPLHQQDPAYQGRQQDEHNGQRYRNINEPFDDAVERILQWFLLQREKLIPPFRDGRERMLEHIPQVAVDQKPATLALTNLQHLPA
jgi:hypothetical protein